MQSSSSVKTPRWNFFSRMLDNPIILKELKGRMRGKQGATIVTVYLCLLALFIIGVYGFLENAGDLSRRDPSFLQETGKALFATVVIGELLMIAFIAPALTSGSIATERDRQTLDLLRVSTLSPRNLVMGKLGSAVAYLLLLIFTAIPLQSLAFFLGGVGLTELIVSVVMLIASAFLFCALGLYFSCVAKRALTATILSYAFLLLPVILLLLLFFLIVSSNFFVSDMPMKAQSLLIRFLWTLYSTNPLVAAFGGEALYLEEQALFIYFMDGPDNALLTMLSPWLIYVSYSAIMTVLMIWLSVFYLKRHEY